MKTLVIYYSLTGNTKLIAEKIADELHADLLQLETIKEEDVSGVMKYFWLGKQVFSKTEPPLKPFHIDPDQYDLIILGTPVWAWTYVPAFRTFFSKVKFNDKKIALFCCHGGGPGKIFEKMREAVLGNEIVGELDLRDPLKKETEAKILQAEKWAKGLLSLP